MTEIRSQITEPGKIPNPKHQPFKFQNTSTKLQINLKLQYSMAKQVQQLPDSSSYSIKIWFTRTRTITKSTGLDRLHTPWHVEP